jgi:hypothetical protein
MIIFKWNLRKPTSSCARKLISFGMQIVIYLTMNFSCKIPQNVNFFFWYQPSPCINIVPSKCVRIWIPSVKDLSLH